MNKALEDLQAGRAPVAPPKETLPDPRSPERAANWSIGLPFFSILVTQAVMVTTKSAPFMSVPLVGLITAVVTVLLLLGGLTLGIRALCCGSGQMSDRPIVRSVFGILLSVGLLAIFATGFVRGYHQAAKNRMLASTVHEAEQQTKSELKKSLEENRTPTALEAQLGLDRMKSSLETVSQNASGPTALLAKASKGYLETLQPLATNYDASLKALLKPPLLDMAGVDRREQLQARKQLVQNFLAANDRLEAFVTNRAKLYRQALEKAAVPAEYIETALNSKSFTGFQENDLTRRIREDDRRMGTAMLGMIEVLNTSFGRWKYNAERKKVEFDEPAALDKYIVFRDELEIASQDQKKLQAKLLELASR